MPRRSCNWLWSIISMALSWRLLAISMNINRAFSPNQSIIYRWCSLEILTYRPYQQPDFKCLQIMPRRSCNWLWSIVSMAASCRLVTISMNIIRAFSPNQSITYRWGSLEILIYRPYQQPDFKSLRNMPRRSCSWLWSIVSMAFSWCLLTISMNIIRAFSPNQSIIYRRGSLLIQENTG